MPKFIYVFNEDDKECLLKLKYELLRNDDAQGIYVFNTKDHENFSMKGLAYALSDTLTF